MNADDYNRKRLESGAIRASDVTQLTREFQEAWNSWVDRERADLLVVDGYCGPRTLGMLYRVAPIDRVRPMPALADGRKPTITSGHRLENPSRPTHYGCDLMYAYNAAVDPPRADLERLGRIEGNWFTPDIVRVRAFAEGKVERTEERANGWVVDIRHPDNTRTTYRHLAQPEVAKGDYVDAGTPLAALDARGAPAHLHFEYRLHYDDPVTASVNPRVYLEAARP